MLPRPDGIPILFLIGMIRMDHFLIGGSGVCIREARYAAERGVAVPRAGGSSGTATNAFYALVIRSALTTFWFSAFGGDASSQGRVF